VSATVVAVLEKRGRFWAAEPQFPASRGGEDGRRGRGSRRIVLGSNRVSGPGGGMAGVGDLVLVQVSRARGPRAGAGQARIVRVLGRPQVARDVIEGLLLDRGLARAFDPAVEREARGAAGAGLDAAESEVARGSRRDLRGLATFTIDPQGAQDFDDALSAERLPDGGVRVWVHIADVSAFVAEASLLDHEARRRSTSVYAPGAVEPMLPPALSNDACSLMPAVERPAVTVEIDLHGARVARTACYRSLIRSDARLDYERVDRVFARVEPALEPWNAPLQAARAAAAALAEARLRHGTALTLDAPEPEFEFDAGGRVRAVRLRAQTESHRLIEHLMIAANEAVARLLSERGVPCLYRVHERPAPERVRFLVAQLASLGVPTPAVPDLLSPSQAAALMGELSRRVERHVASVAARARAGDAAATPSGGRAALTGLVLRALQQASYSPRNIGHAGLGSACYCHFTSPIRRYPDLVCHRALLSALGEPEQPPRAGELADLGVWTSEREREAMAIERDADDVARCFLLEGAMYEHGWELPFAGEVVGLISAGAFVAFGSDADGVPPYEGLLPVRRLRDASGERDWWELNELSTVLRGERSSETLRLADPVSVRVARVDPPRGRVELIPAVEPSV
jgi:ribonuclease R